MHHSQNIHSERLTAIESQHVATNLTLLCGPSFWPPALAIGFNAFLRPASGLAVFRIPTPTEPYGRRVALGLMRVYGSRNMAIGLSVLAMWYYSQFKVMGLACLAGCIMTTTDGFVAREVVGGKEW